jgi:hypothetical protein
LYLLYVNNVFDTTCIVKANMSKIIAQGSSLGIATGFGLDGKIQFLAGARDFSLLHSTQTGSGAHPTSFSMGTGVSFPRVKRPGCEVDTPPSGPCSRMVELYLCSHICLHGIVLN